jgi:hypothetical protein
MKLILINDDSSELEIFILLYIDFGCIEYKA